MSSKLEFPSVWWSFGVLFSKFITGFDILGDDVTSSSVSESESKTILMLVLKFNYINWVDNNTPILRFIRRRLANISREDSIGRGDSSREDSIGRCNLFLLFFVRVWFCFIFFLGGPEASVQK